MKIINKRQKILSFRCLKYLVALFACNGYVHSQSTTVSFTSSNLPILVITTQNNQTIVNDPKITAKLGIIDNGPQNRNKLTDAFNGYDGFIGIEIHGNSTASFPKKPYTMETRDELGLNNNVSLLGMPVENDWVLSPYYIDRTFIRNPLAYHMSQLTGQWAPRARHCELVLNGVYQGIYVLVEKISRDVNRVNINKLKETEISGDDLTGGYIYEISGQYNDFGENRRLKYPDIESVMPEQLNYIQKYDDDFRNLMRSGNYTDPVNGYEKWIDVNSFISFLLINEALRNPDGFGWSGYFHKDKLGKLKAGPLWDFDQSGGNSSYNEGWRTDLWYCEMKEKPDPFFWELLLNEPKFASQTKKTWQKLRENEFKTENLFLFIDSIAGLLNESQVRNFTKWPILGKFIWRETPGYATRNTYQKEVDYLKQYCKARWAWMDKEIAQIPDITGIEQPSVRDHNIVLFSDLAVDQIHITCLEGETDLKLIEIYNTQGEQVTHVNTNFQLLPNQPYTVKLVNHIPTGLYICKVTTASGEIISKKFIKR